MVRSKLLLLVLVLTMRSTLAVCSTVALSFGSDDIAVYPSRSDSLQNVFVLKFALPRELSGKRIDFASIEFYADASLRTQITEGNSTIIEVLPLTQSFTGDGDPKFVGSRAVRNVVLGTKKRILLDITEVIRDWAANRRENHGLIIGSLRGTKAGVFALRSDALDGQEVVRIKIHFQNRTGNRISR